MSYELRNKKKKSSRSTILCIILGIAYFVFGIAIVCIWLFYNRTIKEAQNALLETDESEDSVISDCFDTVSKIGGYAIHEITESMIKAARPEEGKNTNTVTKETLDTVSKIGGNAVHDLVDDTMQLATQDKEANAREEAERAAREAHVRKINDLKRRKKQLDEKISVADSRHRAATRTVPITPAFENTDSDATRQIAAQQSALKARLRKEADNAGRELRKLKIERQRIIHEISKLEK